MHCHAGCDQHRVIEAMKAALGLWPEREHQSRRIAATYNYTDSRPALPDDSVPAQGLQATPDTTVGSVLRQQGLQVEQMARDWLAANVPAQTLFDNAIRPRHSLVLAQVLVP